MSKQDNPNNTMSALSIKERMELWKHRDQEHVNEKSANEKGKAGSHKLAASAIKIGKADLCDTGKEINDSSPVRLVSQLTSHVQSQSPSKSSKPNYENVGVKPPSVSPSLALPQKLSLPTFAPAVTVAVTSFPSSFNCAATNTAATNTASSTEATISSISSAATSPLPAFGPLHPATSLSLQSSKSLIESRLRSALSHIAAFQSNTPTNYIGGSTSRSSSQETSPMRVGQRSESDRSNRLDQLNQSLAALYSHLSELERWENTVKLKEAEVERMTRQLEQSNIRIHQLQSVAQVQASNGHDITHSSEGPWASGRISTNSTVSQLSSVSPPRSPSHLNAKDQYSAATATASLNSSSPARQQPHLQPQTARVQPPVSVVIDEENGKLRISISKANKRIMLGEYST